MCTVYKGAKFLIDFLKEKLCGYFDGLSEGNLQICLYRRPYDKSGGNGPKYKWECLYNENDNKTELESMLQEYPKGRKLAEKWGQTSGKYLVWVKDCEEVKDSRLESSGNLSCLAWMVFMTKKCEAVDMLFEVSLAELIEKLDDMLLLENMFYLLGRDDNETGVENVKNYFLSSFLDKETIVNRYCRETLRVNQLPDWTIWIQLSAMFYEKRTVKTRIYFYEDNMSDEYLNVKLDKPIAINSENCRTVRKLMEMAGEGRGLAVIGAEQSMEIVGIVRDNMVDMSIVNIEFAEHMVWRIKRGNTDIFEYRKGECRISRWNEWVT